ncbi:MAG: DnaA N-terminal domain-containing protein, partial [Prochlorococcaceae cyanobacterium]
MQQGQELWHQVQEALQANLSKPTFETWIRPARCSGLQGDQLLLEAPNSFACGWLRKNYLGTIEAVASEIAGRPMRVQVATAREGDSPGEGIGGNGLSGPAGGLRDDDNGRPASPLRSTATGETPRKLAPGLNPRYVFNRFVVGPNSRMA